MSNIERDARVAADFAAIRRAIAFAHGVGYSAAEAEAAITRLHSNHRGAVGLLRELADEAAKAVCEPRRFMESAEQQGRLSDVLTRARAVVRGQCERPPAAGPVEERDEALRYLRELRLRTGNSRAVERTMVDVRKFLDRLGGSRR